jgi:hypothetical protein
MYQAIITKLENVTPIEGADNIMKAMACGYQVVVSKDYKEGMVGVFFPTDGCFSHLMAYNNNLYRKDKGENKTLGKFGYLDSNRRIKNIRLKKVLSEGIFMSLDCLNWTGVNPGILKVGDTFDIMNGHLVAEKYFTPSTIAAKKASSPKSSKSNNAPEFLKHYDTMNLLYYQHLLTEDTEVLVTEKLHGTSGRTGNVHVILDLPWWAVLWNRFMFWTGLFFKPKQVYALLSGTRNTVLTRPEGDGYHSGTFRQQIHNSFVNKLHPGEIVYYEIVGYESPGATPIMARHHVPQDMDKAFKARYGSTITYSYGVPTGEHKVYVYRIVHITDGVATDLSWEQIVNRCKNLNVETVPILARFTIGPKTLEFQPPLLPIARPAIEHIKDLTTGSSILDDTHPKEGVCVRILNGPRENSVFKYKSPVFNYMEGHLKEAPDYVDLEEIS